MELLLGPKHWNNIISGVFLLKVQHNYAGTFIVREWTWLICEIKKPMQELKVKVQRAYS